MRNVLSTLACAVALCAGPAAQAALVTFNNPTLIDIDPVTNLASYNEAGFTFSGDAASFALQDSFGSGDSGSLVGLANSVLTLTASSGGLFNLQSLDFGFFPLQEDVLLPKLLVEGLQADRSLPSETLGLGALANFGFTKWSGLREVRFSANANFVLDNVSAVAVPLAVPEPASWALIGLALVGLGASRRRWR